MTAYKIMNRDSMWGTWDRTVFDCNDATRNATDYADWRESGVLHENALDAEGFMAEAMK